MGIQASLRTAAEGVGLRVLVAYLNVALLGGGLVFMTSYHPDRTRGPLGWLAASGLAWLAAISCWTLAGLPSILATTPWIILAGAIPAALLALGADFLIGLLEHRLRPAR